MRVAVAAAWFLALAQTQQPPAFRSGVSLVSVDVMVTDADGLPVPGLTAADFEIRLDNRAQSVRAVRYLRVAETMAGAVGPAFDAAPVASSAGANVTTVPRVFVVLVDDLSFSPPAGRELFASVRRFVSALPATDAVGLTTSSGTVAVNPTTERAPILAALPTIVGAFPDPRVESSGPAENRAVPPDHHVGLSEALDIDRGDTSALKRAIAGECFGGDTQIFNGQSLEQVLVESSCARQVQSSATRSATRMKSLVRRQAQSYEAVIRAMRGASGIRHLVVVTGGIPLPQDMDTMRPVGRAAAESGVEISMLMATPGLDMAGAGRRAPAIGERAQADPGAPQRRREDQQLLLNGARTTADMAGGEFYQITGAPDRFFERIRSASGAIYRLAVDAPADTPAGKEFALTARVPGRQGITARAHRHAIAAAPAAATGAAAPAPAIVTPAEQMRRAIASGRALTGLDITIEPSVRRAADPAQVAIDVAIAVAASARAPLTTTFGLVDAAGAIRTSDKRLDAPDTDGRYRLTFSVPIAPGSYKLRFAAADAGGAVGAIETDVDATLTKMGAIQAGGIALARFAGPPPGVVAAIELYVPSGALVPDLLVKMALVSGAEPVVERVIVPESFDGVLRAEAEFLTDALPPGTYAVRATVLSGATVLGTATRPLPR